MLNFKVFAQFFYDVAGFFLLVWPLHGVLLGVFIDYFALLCRLPRVVQKEFLFSTGCPIARMACVIFLALSAAALLGFGW